MIVCSLSAINGRIIAGSGPLVLGQVIGRFFYNLFKIFDDSPEPIEHEKVVKSRKAPAFVANYGRHAQTG